MSTQHSNDKYVTPMGFFKKNIQSLRNVVGDLPGHPSIEITKSGDCSVIVSGIRIASIVNPRAEGNKWVKRIDLAKANNVFIYGFGLGYHLEALKEILPSDRLLLVVEPNREILSAAFHSRDLTDLLSDPRFLLITGETEMEISRKLSSAFSEMEREWEIMIHLPSFRCIPDGFPHLKNMFESLRTERRFKGSFGLQERFNIVTNAHSIATSPGVASIFGTLKGYPAVLVGAGPSLDRNLGFLEALQGKVFLMAVDTALPVLEKNRIACDAVISVDPQSSSAIHFFDRKGTAPLIFIPSTHPFVVDRYYGNRMLMIKDGQEAIQKIQSLLEDRGVSYAGGSVSCLGLDLLIKMGANPIGVIGQDFSFPRGKAYNRSTLVDFASSPEKSGIDMEMLEALSGANEPLKIRLTTHEEGESYANLISYLRGFEMLIEQAQNHLFYNINSEGAKIRGCSNLFSWTEAAIRLGAPLKREHKPLTFPVETVHAELEEMLQTLNFEKQ